jgi:hypothetical protein
MEKEGKAMEAESRKDNSRIKKSRSAQGKTRNMGICNGKGLVSHCFHWFLFILCIVRMLLIIFFFLFYQDITIVVIDLGAISYCNGFCGNNCTCAIPIESVVGIGTWNVMYKI